MLNSDESAEWVAKFHEELLAGLESQFYRDAVELFVVSESPRVIAVITGAEGELPEAVIRNIDYAIAVDKGATLESVALDIAVSDIAEPGPPGKPLNAQPLEPLKKRWPNITFVGDLDLYSAE